MRTGKKVWDVQVADPKKGFRYSAAVADRQGQGRSPACRTTTSSTRRTPSRLTMRRTGKELWRTRTIALPERARRRHAGATCRRVFRAGADMWITGGYDPELDLIYWSTAQAKPFSRAARGTDGDALYSNSTLALDPDDGRIVWYRQWIPGEQHDMDEVFEHVLVDRDGRKSLFKMGKLGILWEADRRTGQFINATDMGYQNLVDLDKKTGKVTYRPGMTPQLGKPMDHCPHISGLHSWRAMAYHPEMRALYFPLQLACNTITYTDVKKEEGGGGVGIGAWKVYPHPESDGNLGEFVAMDLSGKILWRLPSARDVQLHDAHDGGRARVHRGLEPVHRRLRRQDRRAAVADAGRRVGAGRDRHLRRARPAVHRRSRGHGRLVVVEPGAGRGDSRAEAPEARQCGRGVRVARHGVAIACEIGFQRRSPVANEEFKSCIRIVRKGEGR